MLKAISNTSPLLYLYRINGMEWLPQIFDEIVTTQAVMDELQSGQRRGYDVPNPLDYKWLLISEPKHTPSQWLVSDLGAGELQAMSLALEYADHIVILDDLLARRIATAAGLEVWGTLRILLESKKKGIVTESKAYVETLRMSGLYLSEEVKNRILALAGE